MGVINLTPNSFSDGGNYRANFNCLMVNNFDILDFGAESTAPFNDPISEEQEWQRIISSLDGIDLKNKVISIDTYKIKTMEMFLKTFKAKLIIINDVSGCLEPEYLEFLKDHPNVNFVFSHNLAPNREQTSNHMNYVSKNKLEIRAYFHQAYEKLRENGLESRVIFDPCFGFSKSRAQNISLIKEIPSIIKSFPIDLPWLIGISRKSFLREDPKMNVRDPKNHPELDQIGSNLMTYMMSELKLRPIIFRTHETKSFQAALKSLKYL